MGSRHDWYGGPDRVAFHEFYPLRFLLGCVLIGKMGLELLRCADPRDSAEANSDLQVRAQPVSRLHRERL
jgi:hypothetical protein